MQLYHAKDCGTPDFPHSYREFYDVAVGVDSYGSVALRPIDRGPIFAADGTPRKRDWDTGIRSPMLISVFEDGYELHDEDSEPGQKITHYDVYSGRVVNTFRQWLLSPYERYVKTAKEKGKNFRAKVEGMAAEGSKQLWKDANKSDTASITLAKKHMREDPGVKKLNAWKDAGGTAALEDTFMPPAAPKASA